MHIWSALAVREGSLLAILLLLGSGPASFLPDRFGAAGRIAMAPVLGFCLGTCVTTTVLEFEPVSRTYWLLLPLAAVSSAAAAVRIRKSGSLRGLRLADVAALLVVCVAVTAPTTYVLHRQHTVGPAAFNTVDVDNYVAVQDAAQTTSLRAGSEALNRHVNTRTRFADITQYGWSSYANGYQNLDATPLDSSVNALLGLAASDTWAPFLLVLQLAGGLGAFAAVRYLTDSRTWTAALAGAMFGGPFFIELWFDGFQAALIGLGLVLPLAVLGCEVLRTNRRTDLVLLVLVLATMLTVYPLWVPLLLMAAAIVLAVHAVAIRRAGADPRGRTRQALVSIGAIVGLTFVFDPIGFTRDVRYYKSILGNQIALPRLNFDLPPEVLPGWVTQTREFWNMPSFGTGGLEHLVTGFLLPLVFLVFIVIGLRHHRTALTLVLLAAVCGLVAFYSYESRQACTYCAERNLLPWAPITAVLLAIGLSVALASKTRAFKIAGVVGALLLVVAVSARTRVELHRFAQGAYFLDTRARVVLSRLPSAHGAVQIEGFEASVYAAAEEPLAYHLVNERAPGRTSIIAASNVYSGLAYLGGQVIPPGPEFKPSYRYVFTRLGGISTDRRLIARAGGIALEQRTQPLDVTPVGGLGVSLDRYDPSGVGWVQPQFGPLVLYVNGWDGPQPAWVRLTFLARQPVTVRRQPGVAARHHGATLTLCVRAYGQQPIRQAKVWLSAAPFVVPGPPGFARPMPQEGVALTGMRTVTNHCRV